VKTAFRSLWLAVVLLASCTWLGLDSPQTFNERLAVGYTSVTAVRLAATDLLLAKKISVDDAQNVLEQSDNARAGLDIARTLNTVDPEAADRRLQSILTGLKALQAYLNSAGATP